MICLSYFTATTADLQASTETNPSPASPEPFFLPPPRTANEDADTNFLANKHPAPLAFATTSFQSKLVNDAGFLAPILQSQ